jgi:hypothetical protein
VASGKYPVDRGSNVCGLGIVTVKICIIPGVDLSIVIVSFNVRELLSDCLESIFKLKTAADKWQVIVADNDSMDGTVSELREKFPMVEIIASRKNLGFAGGNNLARKKVEAATVLFLNPDTRVTGRAIRKSLEVLKSRTNVGAVTCKVLLPGGEMDYSCHRGLPTVWNTLCYWTGLGKCFPKSKLLAGYKATYLDVNTAHEIECVSGTFLMIRREILEDIGWWDTDYYWNGEDIEMCYRLKQAGWKIWYMPDESIIHYKGSSSGLWSTARNQVDKTTKIRSAKSAAAAMRIFVGKHRQELGPGWVMTVVNAGIWVLEKYRLFKINHGFKYA